MATKLAQTTKTLALESNHLPHVYVDDMLMSLKYYVDEHEAHLHILYPEVCTHCESKGCLYFCPVGAYQEEDFRQNSNRLPELYRVRQLPLDVPASERCLEISPWGFWSVL